MRRQRIWYRDLHLGEGAVEEEKFLHIRKIPHGQELGGRGEAPEPQRGIEQQVLGRQNRENSPSGADQNFPNKILFTLAQQQVGAGCKGSGFGDQTPKRGLRLSAVKIL